MDINTVHQNNYLILILHCRYYHYIKTEMNQINQLNVILLFINIYSGGMDLRLFIPRFFPSIARTQRSHSSFLLPSLGWYSKHFVFTHLKGDDNVK